MQQNLDQARFDKVKDFMYQLQTSIIQGLEQVSGDRFSYDLWEYQGGKGGGRTGVVQGEVIEKGGVNFSAIQGSMNPKIAEKMGVKAGTAFSVTGVSLVIHPKNPYVPTVHSNVRFFDTAEKSWFGGGIDLTPYYPFKEDVIAFHKILKDCCNRHDPSFYLEYKKWCDQYFFLTHRNETRGVGGIFFDYLAVQNDDKASFEKTLAFVQDVGNSFLPSYVPIVAKRQATAYEARQKEFQRIRRGRYVEFNLIYDRGTLFGLETRGRTESILMSMPPEAIWKYNWSPEQGTEEAQLLPFLQPQAWL